MKFSYNWLKELSQTEKSPDELAELLPSRSFEVEEVKEFGHGFDGVIVGEVLEAEQHPNADRLKVTEVSTGDGTRQIVCGAPNVAVGQRVPVVLPGTVLPNGMAIESADIRGATSLGMIASEAELGVGRDTGGIWTLPCGVTIGRPLADVMGLSDTILDVKILPNRGTDALSHHGLAREIAALEHRAFPSEHSYDKVIPAGTGTGGFEIEIEARAACRAYAGLVFSLPQEPKGLPLPLRGRMFMLGQNAIHPAADIANHLSLLYGQPMHAFDAGRLSGKKVIVRFAKQGETLLLLDDREIALTSEDLVIADENGPVALAGIMGGKDSAVSSATTDVFFEIANFDAGTIRRSRVWHGIPTDAAYLFEHSVDPSWPEKLRGEVIASFTDLLGAEYRGSTFLSASDAQEEREIVFPFDRIEGLLGVAVPEDDVLSILRSLSIGAEIRDGKLHAAAPSFRPDLGKEADIIEEVGRVYGYEHIVPLAPKLPLEAYERDAETELERRVKDFLAHDGFDEIMTYSFYGKDLLGQSGVPEDTHLFLENPMNPDQAALRAKLLPTVLEKAIENMPRTDGFRLFEFGRIHFRKDARVFEEKRIACAVSVKESNPGEAFFALKGRVERLMAFLRADDVSFEPARETSPLFHPGRSARIIAGGELVGIVGETHPSFTKKFGSRRIAIAELSFPILLRSSGMPIIAKPVPRFPSVARDISLVVPKGVLFEDLRKTIVAAGGELLSECVFFDVYEKGPEKNVAFHLFFGADDRTIDGDEADEAFRNIVSATEKAFTARLAV